MPYISEDTKTLKNEREINFKAAITSNKPDDWIKYRTCRNRTLKALNKDKSDYIKGCMWTIKF